MLAVKALFSVLTIFFILVIPEIKYNVYTRDFQVSKILDFHQFLSYNDKKR